MACAAALLHTEKGRLNCWFADRQAGKGTRRRSRLRLLQAGSGLDHHCLPIHAAPFGRSILHAPHPPRWEGGLCRDQPGRWAAGSSRSRRWASGRSRSTQDLGNLSIRVALPRRTHARTQASKQGRRQASKIGCKQACTACARFNAAPRRSCHPLRKAPPGAADSLLPREHVTQTSSEIPPIPTEAQGGDTPSATHAAPRSPCTHLKKTRCVFGSMHDGSTAPCGKQTQVASKPGGSSKPDTTAGTGKSWCCRGEKGKF